MLTDRGLAPALRDVAQRASLPVELDALPDERLPGPVEAAAFFTVSEALTNVARYAQATVAHVDVRTAGGQLAIEVSRRRRRRRATPASGSGLRGLADRLAALGGELRVVSPPGRGTTLSATIPLDQPEPARARRTSAAREHRRAAAPGPAVPRRRVRARDGAARLHLADHGRRLLLAAMGDRGLGTAARAPRLVRASASRGYARPTDASGSMRGGMGAKKKAAKAGAAAAAVKRSPYVQRIAEDEELRQNLWNAYESARDAVGRLQNGKHPHKQIFDDKKLQKDIKSAAESFKEASVALREAPKKKRKGGLGKLILLGIVGAGVALALSEDLRKKLLDALFGAEEEFEYTSTTAPASSPARPRPRTDVRRTLPPAGGRPTGALRRSGAGSLAGDEVAHLDERAGARLGVGAVAGQPAAARELPVRLPRREDLVRVDRLAVVRMDLEVDVRRRRLRVAGVADEAEQRAGLDLAAADGLGPERRQVGVEEAVAARGLQPQPVAADRERADPVEPCRRRRRAPGCRTRRSSRCPRGRRSGARRRSRRRSGRRRRPGTRSGRGRGAARGRPSAWPAAVAVASSGSGASGSSGSGAAVGVGSGVAAGSAPSTASALT